MCRARIPLVESQLWAVAYQCASGQGETRHGPGGPTLLCPVPLVSSHRATCMPWWLRGDSWLRWINKSRKFPKILPEILFLYRKFCGWWIIAFSSRWCNEYASIWACAPMSWWDSSCLSQRHGECRNQSQDGWGQASFHLRRWCLWIALEPLEAIRSIYLYTMELKISLAFPILTIIPSRYFPRWHNSCCTSHCFALLLSSSLFAHTLRISSSYKYILGLASPYSPRRADPSLDWGEAGNMDDIKSSIAMCIGIWILWHMLVSSEIEGKPPWLAIWKKVFGLANGVVWYCYVESGFDLLLPLWGSERCFDVGWGNFFTLWR